MGDGRFGSLSLDARDVLVEVGQAPRHALRYVTEVTPGKDVPLQVVGQRALHTHTHTYTHTHTKLMMS